MFLTQTPDSSDTILARHLQIHEDDIRLAPGNQPLPWITGWFVVDSKEGYHAD